MRGVTRTHLNPKTFLSKTFIDIAFLNITVNTPPYMALLIILRSRYQAIYIYIIKIKQLNIFIGSCIKETIILIQNNMNHKRNKIAI
jgi:hypothetical protein